MDRDEISRERRRQRLSERLGHQGRKGEDHEENEGKDNNTHKIKWYIFRLYKKPY